MRLTPFSAYVFLSLLLAAAIIVLKPIYTKSYANVPNAFAPTHIALATKAPCEAYALLASTNKIALDYDKQQEPFRFYLLESSALDSSVQAPHKSHAPKPKELESSSTHICALARNAITAPLASLKLSASEEAMRHIEFIAIAMGSESFYITMDSILGEQCGSVAKLTKETSLMASGIPCFAQGATAKVAIPQSVQSSHSPTAIPRILEEKGAGRAKSASSPSQDTAPAVAWQSISAQEDSRARDITLDLSSYKLNPSSEILNLYDSIWLGFFYYFLSPPFLLIWLACVCLWIALKPKRKQESLARKYQQTITLGAILALAVILRLYHYDSFSLWLDELYSVGVVGYPDGDFASVFKDPGNPPFYNLLLKLWLHCFGYTSSAARGLSVVIGSFGVVGIYLLLRDHACSERDCACGLESVISLESKAQNKKPAKTSHTTLESKNLDSRDCAISLSLRGGGKATNEAIHKKDSNPKVDCHDFASAKSRNDKKLDSSARVGSVDSKESMDCHATATALARNDGKLDSTNATILDEPAKDSRAFAHNAQKADGLQAEGFCDDFVGCQGVGEGIYLVGNEQAHAADFRKSAQKTTPIPLIGAFFYAISFVAIGAAHEVRGYVLELALLPFVFYFLLHFLKAPRISNALGYVLSGAMVCNTHYYGAVMILAGFIASAVLLWQATLSARQKRRRLATLFLLDVLIASSLVPFFAITAYTKALSDTSFNTWIPAPSLNNLAQFLPQALGNSSGAFIFIVLLLLTPMLKNRFLNFCVICLALGVLLPFIASFVRPIYYPKYAIYATYTFALAFCSTAVVLLARRAGGSSSSLLTALLVCMLSVSLLDHRVQPIGVGDNTRAKFRFITLDSINEASKNAIDSSAQGARIYIIDLHTTMAYKQRQYEIYGFSPSAEFLRISALELAQRHFHKGDILYLDSYFVDKPTMQEILSALSAQGARIYPIPFGIQEERDLRESQDVVYKVIF